MTGTKLICPHCGHDGTQETSKPPLGSYGFNYLAEGVVCREVCGSDPAGRLLLSGDFKCEGSQGTNARMECRSCWRTFPVPEGMSLAAPTESVRQTGEVPAVVAASATPGAESAAHAISRNLLAILQATVEEAGRVTAGQVAKLEAEVAGLTRAVQSLQPLADEVPALRDQAAALSQSHEQAGQRLAEQTQTLAALGEQQSRWRGEVAEQTAAAAQRVDALEAGLAELREAAGRTGEVFAQVQEAQQTGRLRLDAQADVIRALHAAAQEQISRREELRAAVQKLEELASGLDNVKPLPNAL